LKKVEQNGSLQEMEPTLIEDSLHYYTQNSEKELKSEIMNGKILLENFFALSKSGDYIALLAYLPEEPEVEKCFSNIKSNLNKSLHLPISLQYGPRYLHSTGQFHKGGPNKGFHIQFICDSSDNISIPGQPYTFGLLKKAQANGDMQALIDNERKVILIDLGKDYINGLKSFEKVIQQIQPLEKTSNPKVNSVGFKEKKKLELA
jgi:hypothetical protein